MSEEEEEEVKQKIAKKPSVPKNAPTIGASFNPWVQKASEEEM